MSGDEIKLKIITGQEGLLAPASFDFNNSLPQHLISRRWLPERF
jgi:hypothetical protein